MVRPVDNTRKNLGNRFGLQSNNVAIRADSNRVHPANPAQNTLLNPSARIASRPRISAPALGKSSRIIKSDNPRRQTLPSRITPSKLHRNARLSLNANNSLEKRLPGYISSNGDSDSSSEATTNSESGFETEDELQYVVEEPTVGERQLEYDLLKHLKNGLILERNQREADAVSRQYESALVSAKDILIETLVGQVYPKISENFAQITAAAATASSSERQNRAKFITEFATNQNEAAQLIERLKSVDLKIRESRHAAKDQIAVSHDRCLKALAGLQKTYAANQVALLKKLHGPSRTTSAHVDKKKKSGHR